MDFFFDYFHFRGFAVRADFLELGGIGYIKGTGEASPVRGRDWAGFKFAAT